MSGTTHVSPSHGHGRREPRRYRSGMGRTVLTRNFSKHSKAFLKTRGSTSKEKQARRAARLAA